jgi:hypothetical protein
MARKKSAPPTEDEYHLALVKALSTWGGVEHELSRLFAWGIRPCDPILAARVLFSVANFRDRLGMVNAAIRDQMDNKTKLADWDKLRERTRTHSLRRNAIAHAFGWTGPESGAYGAGAFPFLLDLPIEWKKCKQRVLTPQALDIAAAHFKQLYLDLRAFKPVAKSAAHVPSRDKSL